MCAYECREREREHVAQFQIVVGSATHFTVNEWPYFFLFMCYSQNFILKSCCVKQTFPKSLLYVRLYLSSCSFRMNGQAFILSCIFLACLLEIKSGRYPNWDVDLNSHPVSLGEIQNEGKADARATAWEQKTKKILFLERMPVAITNSLTTHSLNVTVWSAFEFKSADYDCLVAWWF